MKSLQNVSAAILGVLIISGCAARHSETPLATNFPTTKQEKLQAASHWEAITADMAKELSASLPTPLTGSLYVQTAQESPFNRAVKDQLITSLVQSGHPIAKTPDAAIKVEVDTQVVEFSPNRSQNKWIGVPTALVTGAWALRAVETKSGANTTAAVGVTALAVGTDIYRWFKSEDASGHTPRTEIIVNVSVSDDHRYIARTTNVYYVTDTDRELYDAAGTKVFYVVGGR